MQFSRLKIENCWGYITRIKTEQTMLTEQKNRRWGWEKLHVIYVDKMSGISERSQTMLGSLPRNLARKMLNLFTKASEFSNATRSRWAFTHLRKVLLTTSGNLIKKRGSTSFRNLVFKFIIVWQMTCSHFEVLIWEMLTSTTLVSFWYKIYIICTRVQRVWEMFALLK